MSGVVRVGDEGRLRRWLPRCLVGIMLAVVGGCATVASPVYHGPRSDHFDGKRFHNYIRFRDQQIEDALRRVGREIRGKRGKWPKWEEVSTDVPPSRVTAGALRVTFVNHATVLIQMDSLNILTDPVWSKRISPVRWYGPKRHRPPGIRFADLPPIDIVLLSHNHYDHMDVPTLRRLVSKFHPRIITGLGNAKFLARNGVPGAEDMDWWQATSIAPGIRVVGVPAQHWSARWLNDKWRTLWLGFVIENPSGNVYFAGDTGFAEFLMMVHDRFGPFRLALLPIAPALPRKAMAPRHMSAGDAVRAYQLLGASTAIALHFGTFQQGNDSEREPVDSLESAVKGALPCQLRFWALRNGEFRVIPPAAEAPEIRCLH
jgi:L-ascorbate metabolism protein UlaG (beta-lactamase superfamily)